MSVDQFLFRPPTLGDAAAIERLERACFGAGALPRISIVQYLELFARSSLVVEHEGLCVGVAIAGVPADEPASAWILDIAVLPEMQGRRVASRLLGRVLEDLESRGVSAIRASVEPGNAASLSLFLRAGFSVERTDAGYFGPGERRHILLRSRGEA